MHPIPTPPTHHDTKPINPPIPRPVQIESDLSACARGGFPALPHDARWPGIREPGTALRTRIVRRGMCDRYRYYPHNMRHAALCTRRVYARRRPHALHASFSLHARLDHTPQRTLGTAQRHRVTPELPAIETPRPMGWWSASHDSTSAHPKINWQGPQRFISVDRLFSSFPCVRRPRLSKFIT